MKLVISNDETELKFYLLDQLDILKSHLDSELYERVLLIVHEQIVKGIHDFTCVQVKKKSQPPTFRQLYKMLEMVNGVFDCWTVAESYQLFDDIQKLLKLHGADTEELIHRYVLERMTAKTTDDALGSITVRASFIGDQLKLDILNGRNLKPMDKSGSSDPYVKVKLLPEDLFVDQTTQKTKVHKETLFPLFDETFTLLVYFNLIIIHLYIIILIEMI